MNTLIALLIFVLICVVVYFVVNLILSSIPNLPPVVRIIVFCILGLIALLWLINNFMPGNVDLGFHRR
jgi:hypothetical protein